MRLLAVWLLLLGRALFAQNWHFVVSGDSRNCGDVVMPAIAKGAIANKAEFYWHLGDFRAINRFDQDYAQLHKPTGPNRTLMITDYLANAWPDFIEHQLKPFGNMPVFLAFGNHDIMPPKTREDWYGQFADWLDAPIIKEQRLRDDPDNHSLHGYYHWIKDGIDFITLDNAGSDFDKEQLEWLHRLLRRDQADGAIRAIVVGMHEALPNSISADHSMNQTPDGIASGVAVYAWLLDLKKSGKAVYTLGSHSHYYMEGVYNTEYWRTHGGVLPGWIIGTAGAERYPLPPAAKDAIVAKTHVYGYMLATVTSSEQNPVQFEFKQLEEKDVPEDVVKKFTPELVHTCWVDNPAPE
ncbi:MAG: metallophosphoesterase [Acidobacteriaceae bacterium]|nr:metallophosphoesterase [Acidobacteriaceae bacterium]